jgi:hypothetical protein
LAHLTCGSGGGVWLPTPIANEKGESPKALFERMKKYGRTGSAVHLCLSTAIQMLPTPTARDWKDGTAKSCANVPVNSLLGRAVHMLPTPLSSNTKATHMRSGGRPPRSYLPTPTASTYGTQTNPGAKPRRLLNQQQIQMRTSSSEQLLKNLCEMNFVLPSSRLDLTVIVLRCETSSQIAIAHHQFHPSKNQKNVTSVKIYQISHLNHQTCLTKAACHSSHKKRNQTKKKTNGTSQHS